MAIAETAQLAVLLTLKDQMSSGISKAEAQLGVLNRTAGSSGVVMGKTGGAMAGLKVAATGMAGGINHAKSAIGGLLSGPLGMIGLGAGIFTLGGAITSSISKVEAFGASLEKVQTLTGETALASGALIIQFQKYGIGVDQIGTMVGFAEKTLGKLNTTQAAATKGAKSAELQNLELVKAQRQAAGASTTAINKLISEQKARDQLIATQAAGAAGMTKLAALDKAYGLQLVDTKGKVVDYSTLLSQLATFYDSNASASTKAYVASQVLGRGYTALIPVLNEGSAGLRAAAAEAASLGLGSADTVKQLAVFHDEMHTLGEQVNVLQLSIGMALLPTLIDLSTTATNFVRDNRDKIVGFFKDATKFAGTMGEALKPIVGIFGGIVSGFNKLPDFAKAALVGTFVANKATNAIFGTGLKGIAGGVGNVLSAMRGSSPATPMFVSDVGKGLGGLAGAAGGAAGAVEGAAATGAGVGLGTVLGSAAFIAAGTAATMLIMNDANQKLIANTGLRPDQLGGYRYQNASAADQQTIFKRNMGVIPSGGLSQNQVNRMATGGDVRDAAYTLGTRIGIDIANATRHAKLNAEIGKKGGAFLRAGDAAGQKTMDANAGKLVQLFQTSTNPSLVSLKQNMANMIAEQRKHPADKVLGADINAMKLMITAAINALPGAIAALGGVNFTQTPAQQRDRKGVTVNVAPTVTPNHVAGTSAYVERNGGLRSLGGNVRMPG